MLTLSLTFLLLSSTLFTFVFGQHREWFQIKERLFGAKDFESMMDSFYRGFLNKMMKGLRLIKGASSEGVEKSENRVLVFRYKPIYNLISRETLG